MAERTPSSVTLLGRNWHSTMFRRHCLKLIMGRFRSIPEFGTMGRSNEDFQGIRRCFLRPNGPWRAGLAKPAIYVHLPRFTMKCLAATRGRRPQGPG